MFKRLRVPWFSNVSQRSPKPVSPTQQPTSSSQRLQAFAASVTCTPRHRLRWWRESSQRWLNFGGTAKVKAKILTTMILSKPISSTFSMTQRRSLLISITHRTRSPVSVNSHPLPLKNRNLRPSTNSVSIQAFWHSHLSFKTKSQSKWIQTEESKKSIHKNYSQS